LILNPKLDDIEITALMGLDLETTGLYPWHGAEVDLIAISNEDGVQYVIEVNNYSIDDLKEFFRSIELTKTLVVGHNIKFDCNFILYHYGVCLSNVFCTQIAAQILDNGRQKELRFSLIDVIVRYLGPAYSRDKEEKKQLQQSFVNPIVRKNLSILPNIRNRQIEYAAEDIEHLIALYHLLDSRLNDAGLDIVSKLERKVLPVLSSMEVQGITIAKEPWSKLVKDWEVELIQLQKLLDEESIQLLNGQKSKFNFNRRRATSTSLDLFGISHTSTLSSDNSINYASTDQLLQLWREFGEEPPKDGEGTVSVGEDAVETYVTEQPNTRLTHFIELLLTYRELSKLVSTYGNSFLNLLDKNNCIHTSYTQTRTETGRLSSKEPNLQNIPASKNPLRDVRRFFIAKPGHKLITCDMKSAEIAIAGDYSKEPLLVDAMKLGVDMHSELASISFSIIFKQKINVTNSETDTISVDGYTYVLGELRGEHKSVTFAKFYKAGAKRVYTTLAKYINRHHPADNRIRVAGDVSNALDARMPQLSRYLSNLIDEAKTTGKLVSDKLGRIRYFQPTVYGEAANYPIQGTNANALKIALVRIDKYLKELGCGSLLMNIHDEVIVEIPENKAEEVAIKVKEIMGDSLSYFLTELKGGASVSISDHWKK
jgi:DNA polymerase-1